MIEKAKKILKSVFGYDQFISLQQSVIENVLRGKDTLAVMPTGGGKSLCYQIPALLFQELTIVVSPLISLMKDQVDQLSQLDIPAVLLNSTLPTDVYRSYVERIRRGEAKLFYAAPETLLKPDVLALLASVPVACLAVDEAHCISEWGPDFRPEYRRLAEIRARMDRAVCIALTATATPRVRADIRTSLGLHEANEFVAGFNRENLFLGMRQKLDSFRQTLEFLERFPNESGIIYCLTKRRVDELCSALQEAGFSAGPYHAGLSDAERTRNQDRFVRDEVRIIVATIAFGMGINKSNVRFVLHHDLPKNIESYYQEIGRSGRDGMRAECLLLFSAGDIRPIKYFIEQKEGVEKRAANLQLNAMLELAESPVCRRIGLLGYFGETFPHEKCGMCDNCLAHEQEMSDDITIPAQKFLSCVKRTGECFGTKHIVDVLLGSHAGKVIKHGHDRLSTYGIGKECSRQQWLQLARQLLHKGLMVKDPQFGGLKLTPRAWDVFRGRELVFGTLSDPGKSETPPAAAGGARAEGVPADTAFHYDPQLFEILRDKRKELAIEANVPPYVIFSDRTLAEMATFFPQTLDGLLDIYGIGEAKLEKYGSTFLGLINEYCLSHSVERTLRRPSVSARPPSPNKRHTLVAESFNAGRSVESLARGLNVKVETVLDHLFRHLQEGGELRSEGLLPLITLSDSQRKKVLEAFERHGPQLLRPIFDALEGRIGYEDLKILRLYHLSAKGRYSMKLVCLAHSRKYAGICVAGKEWLEDGVGAWIRPVGREGAGQLSASDTVLQTGEAPVLLDILTVHLEEGCPHTYQSENHFISEGLWVRHGTVPMSRLDLLCDKVDQLWINGYHSQNGLNDRMPVELVNRTVTSSLLFVRLDELQIKVEEGAKGLKKVRAHFSYCGQTYCLSVTDPLIEARYLSKDLGLYPVEGAQPYATVSIGEPFEEFCYKLVAGIVLRAEPVVPLATRQRRSL